METFFDYKTRILVLEDYPSPNNKKLTKGNTYPVGVRKHPLFGDCYYLLNHKEEWMNGYFIEKDPRLFKEIQNSVSFIKDT
jgi:hypothetical protein